MAWTKAFASSAGERLAPNVGNEIFTFFLAQPVLGSMNSWIASIAMLLLAMVIEAGDSVVLATRTDDNNDVASPNAVGADSAWLAFSNLNCFCILE